MKCTVNMYCCPLSLEGAWVEMYNVLCNGKATIILSCGEDKWSKRTRRVHHPTQGLLSIFTLLLIVYGLETREPREATALRAGFITSEGKVKCQNRSEESTTKFNRSWNGCDKQNLLCG